MPRCFGLSFRKKGQQRNLARKLPEKCDFQVVFEDDFGNRGFPKGEGLGRGGGVFGGVRLTFWGN